MDKIINSIDTVKVDEAKESAIRKSKIYTDSSKLAALTIHGMLDVQNGNQISKADLKTVHNEIISQVDKALSGDTSASIMMLLSQAKTLDLVFNNMIEHAVAAKSIEAMRAYLDMAFRAQNQSRKNILALSTIQNPNNKTFVKQQNIAINQQVNNQEQLEIKEEKLENELLEKKHDAWLDSRTASQTIGINSQLETVAISRSENTRR